MNDAVVVCHHLGYTGTSEAMGFGPGTGDIWMDDVTCIGTEPSLDECQHLGWGIHNCEHMEDAGVRCSLPDTTPGKDINTMTLTMTMMLETIPGRDNKTRLRQ